MAFEYFKYDTGYTNTLVARSKTTFAPLVPPYKQIYYDILIPETQPLYLYRESSGTIIANSTTVVDEYLNATELPPTADGNVTYGEFTGTTAALQANKLDKTVYQTYTGTTIPNTYYNKTQINSYTASTNITIGNKLNTSVFNTFTGTTLPANYYNKTQINSYTASTLTNINSRLLTATFNTWSGTTLPNTYLKKSTFATYTGTTAPAQFASKANAITGATNLGGGNAIFTSVSGNKLQLKSISGGTGISITNTGTQINVCSTISQFNWSGSTTNGVGTYVSGTCIKSNPNMTFNGNTLSVTGNINASTSVCSPIITGSTRVCSPAVIATTCLCSASVTRLIGATTGSTLYLTTTPPAGSIQCPTLFYDTTTKQIKATQLTGGSDSYFYTDKTTVECSTSATFATYLSGTPWNFCTGRYQIDFDAQFGNSGSAGATCVIFAYDGTTIGTCYLNGGQVTGWVSSASLSRDITISSSGCHCLVIRFARGGNTSCMTYGMIRAKRIC